MPALTPLGRSLIPLPGESLPGYLLRLSYRLALPPARIATRTGLVPSGRGGADANLLTAIPDESKAVFAHTTRLTTSQVDLLCLASLEQRYPILAANRPIFAPKTRFCPHCLAGDGSAIQEAFGGPWQRTWHLPVVFACTRHRRLLEHHCPECRQPAHDRKPGTRSALLPAMRALPIHPAQCRSPLDPGLGRTLPTCCGARLDHTPALRRADQPLLDLQNKIVDLLAPNGPIQTISAGRPTTPLRYFADLRALSLLISSTWPVTRHLSPSARTATAVDQYVELQRREIADRQARSATTRIHLILDRPPADAAAGAGLLLIAEHILTGESPDEVRDQLRPLLPDSTRQAARSPFGYLIARSATQPSEGLQAATAPLLKAFTKAGGNPRGRRELLLRTRRWSIEHIPAYLPEDWYERHFTPLADVNPMFLRRTAVLRLVQMAAGGSLGEAAGFLGIATTDTTYDRKGRIYSGAGFVHSGARRQPDPLAFESALKKLAAELDEPTTPLINYQRRRHALKTWAIDEPTWEALIVRLPPIRGPQRPELGDRKRQIASIYVWVQLTSGEHHFAPRPIEVAQPQHIQEAWNSRRNTIWSLLCSNRPRPHYTSLKAELRDLATSLATTIDRPNSTPSAQPPTKPGNRHL